MKSQFSILCDVIITLVRLQEKFELGHSRK